MSEPFIKLARALNDSEVKRRPYTLAVWIDLLINAAWEPYVISFGGQTTVINSGELLAGRRQLAERINLPMSTVEDSLRWLENRQQIRQRKCTKGRIITIVNWDKWQKSDSESDNHPTAGRQRADTIKEYKKIRREEKIVAVAIPNLPIHLNTPEVSELLNEWISYKKEQHNFTYKSLGLRQLVSDVGKRFPSSDILVNAIRFSIASGYKGIFAPKDNGNGHKPQGQFLSRFERQQNILKTQLAKEMVNDNKLTNDTTIDATFSSLSLLPVGRGDK